MTHPYTNVLRDITENSHQFVAISIDFIDGKESFISYVLPVIKEMYGIGADLDQKVEHMDAQKRKNVVAFMNKYRTPSPEAGKDQKPWLKITRNELSELMARDVLTKLHNVKFPFRDYADKDETDMPKLGIDSLGFIFAGQGETFELKHIVLAEVKTSDQGETPPDVVAKGPTSLFYSLQSLANLDSRFRKAIAKAIAKLEHGEFCQMLCEIAASIEKHGNINGIKTKLMGAPLMVRRHDVWCEDDFGKFRTNYDEIQCEYIKFHILTVNCGLVEFADEIYSRLRDGANE